MFGKKYQWLTNAKVLINIEKVSYIEPEGGGVNFVFDNGRELVIKTANIETIRRLLKTGKQ
jgi:hypothetical protein